MTLSLRPYQRAAIDADELPEATRSWTVWTRPGEKPANLGLVDIDVIGAEAERLEARNQATHSFLGRIGRAVQPVFEPLGYDWQLSIGVMASFAAREVFVSTMGTIYGVGGEDDAALQDKLRARTAAGRHLLA